MPQGRAARRRQRARWKKNQRRAVVATAVALVGGGLTVAAMDRNSPARAQAASAPETASMGSTDDQVVQPPDSARLSGAVRVERDRPAPGLDALGHGLRHRGQLLESLGRVGMLAGPGQEPPELRPGCSQ